MSFNTNRMASFSVGAGSGGTYSSGGASGDAGEEFRQELANITAVITDLQTKLSAVASELSRRNVSNADAVGGLVPGVDGSASNPLAVGEHDSSRPGWDAQISNAQQWRKRLNQTIGAYVATG